MVMLSDFDISEHKIATHSVAEGTTNFSLLDDNSSLDRNSTCYFLDYNGDVTLTLDEGVYKNPMFFCLNTATNYTFSPGDGIYYAPIFQLSYDHLIYKKIHFITKSTKIKAPSTKVGTESNYNLKMYADMYIVLLPSFNYTLSLVKEGLWGDCEYNMSCISCFAYTKKKSFYLSIVENSGNSSDTYRLQKSVSRSYKIKLPAGGPYVFCRRGGLTVSGIIGIVVSVIIIIGVTVFSISLFLYRKYKGARYDVIGA